MEWRFTENLSNYLKRYNIVFIDTYTFLDYGINRFLYLYFIAAGKTPNPIATFVHYSVLNELISFSESHNHDLAKRAKFALKLIDNFISQGNIGYYGDKNATDGQKCLYDALATERNKNNCLLFTQNIKLMKNVRTNLSKNNGGNACAASNIHIWLANDFYEGLKVDDILTSADLNVKAVPNEGDVIKGTSGTNYTLQEYLNEGEEGTIYRIGNNKVCKIFKEKLLTSVKQQKIERMIELNYNLPNLAWPLEAVTFKNKFVGYIMNEFTDCFSLNEVVWDRNDTKAHLKNNINMVRLCLSIANVLRYLHQRYIVIGDISPNNILFKDNQAYFIDTDSFQIENFPSLFKTEGFFPPEYITDNYDTINLQYRSENSENFVIAKLFFHIMLNINPYDNKKNIDESDLQRVKKGVFPYPLKSLKDGGYYDDSIIVNDGFAKYKWDSLPYYIKETFFNNLSRADGTNYQPNRRTTAAKWYKLLECYLDELKSLPENDERLILFPTKFFGVNTQTVDKLNKANQPKIKTENIKEKPQNNFDCSSWISYIEDKQKSISANYPYLTKSYISKLNDICITYIKDIKNCKSKTAGDNLKRDFNCVYSNLLTSSEVYILKKSYCLQHPVLKEEGHMNKIKEMRHYINIYKNTPSYKKFDLLLSTCCMTKDKKVFNNNYTQFMGEVQKMENRNAKKNSTNKNTYSFTGYGVTIKSALQASVTNDDRMYQYFTIQVKKAKSDWKTAIDKISELLKNNMEKNVKYGDILFKPNKNGFFSYTITATYTIKK